MEEKKNRRLIAPKYSDEELIFKLLNSQGALEKFKRLSSLSPALNNGTSLETLEQDFYYLLGAALTRMDQTLVPLFNEGDVVTLAEWEKLDHYHQFCPDNCKISHSGFQEFTILRYFFYPKSTGKIHEVEVGVVSKNGEEKVFGIFPALLFRGKE